MPFFVAVQTHDFPVLDDPPGNYLSPDDQVFGLGVDLPAADEATVNFFRQAYLCEQLPESRIAKALACLYAGRSDVQEGELLHIPIRQEARTKVHYFTMPISIHFSSEELGEEYLQIGWQELLDYFKIITCENDNPSAPAMLLLSKINECEIECEIVELSQAGS